MKLKRNDVCFDIETGEIVLVMHFDKKSCWVEYDYVNKISYQKPIDTERLIKICTI